MQTQEEINDGYHAQLLEEIDFLEKAHPAIDPMTEKEFDALDDIALEEYEKDKALGRCAYTSITDYVVMRRDEAARKVNVRAFYMLRFDVYRPYDPWKHTPKYNMKFLYYLCNKAIACGYAQTAEEAVEWANKHK
jgi:hypothetical protein